MALRAGPLPRSETSEVLRLGQSVAGSSGTENAYAGAHDAHSRTVGGQDLRVREFPRPAHRAALEAAEGRGE